MPIRQSAKAKATNALVKAGMSPDIAPRYLRMLDLDQPLKAQIVELAEDMPDLFATEPEDDEANRPMTAREAQLSRLQSDRKHRPMPLRTDSPSALRVAEVLARGGRSADR